MYGKVHKDEIKQWANANEGTKVWCKRKGDKVWVLQESPSWNKDDEYIVDDKNAIRRMAETNFCQMATK